MPNLQHLEGRRKSAVMTNAICVLFWGLSFISIKIAVPVFQPMTLGAVRFAIAIVLLFAMYRFSLKKSGEKNLLHNVKEDLPLLTASGLAGVTFYFFGENNGVALVTASEASIIVAAIPVLTMTADWIAGKLFTHTGARLGWQQWLGALVSMAGVALVAGVSLSISGSIKGYLYMGGAALCWVFYGFLTKPLFNRNRKRIYVVFWQNFFGFLGFLPFAIFERTKWGTPTLPVFAHVLFLAICCSALGYWLYANSLEILGVSVTSVFINLIPLVTVIAGFFILGDRLMPLQWIGGVLVLGGVYLTVLPKKVLNVKKHVV
ncbi:MAG: DMT family transporter [Treponema sp.]|jgi:drug/metabolite transporter (DMT)-like permease|nr:DMT family transporter [Treponema sp.]